MKIPKEYFFVLMTGVLSGLIVFMGQVFANLGLSLYEISTLSYLVSFLVLLPFIFLRKNSRPNLKILPYQIIYGAVSTIVIFSQFAGLILKIPVAIVVLLLYTQPLWTTLISKFVLKEKVTKYNVIGCVLVLIGVAILVNPFHSFNGLSLAGVIVSLIGGLGLSGWIIMGSVISKKGNNPINTMGTNMAFLLLFALILYPIVKSALPDPVFTHWSLHWSLNIWLLIIGYSLFAQITNHLFYLFGAKKVPAADAGIILLLEPVAGAVLAAIFLHQPITNAIVVGGILILLANYLIIRQSSRSVNEANIYHNQQA
jgi:drug/metabolite transporter (DMT)-like permease